MSKQVKFGIRCECGNQFEATLYRSLWIEVPEYRELVFGDKVNRVTCPYCGDEFHVPLALLCTNSPNNIAVWYEPLPDSQIDQDALLYAKLNGASSFLATAPRVANWDEFKEMILKFESGEIIGNPAGKPDFQELARLARQQSGNHRSSPKPGLFEVIKKGLFRKRN